MFRFVLRLCGGARWGGGCSKKTANKLGASAGESLMGIFVKTTDGKTITVTVSSTVSVESTLTLGEKSGPVPGYVGPEETSTSRHSTNWTLPAMAQYRRDSCVGAVSRR